MKISTSKKIKKVYHKTEFKISVNGSDVVYSKGIKITKKNKINV